MLRGVSGKNKKAKGKAEKAITGLSSQKIRKGRSSLLRRYKSKQGTLGGHVLSVKE
jgi:hypothetical protein